MAFPSTQLGLMVELALGADLTAASVGSWSWTDITRYVRFADGITITRGRADEFSTASPAKAAMTLLNDGRFVTRNPTGAYYGQISRNTPLRVMVRPDINTASDAFNRTTSNGFGTADVGGLWQVNGTASEYSTTGSAARLTLATAATRRYAVLPMATYMTFDVTVRIRTAALATGAALSAGVLYHYSLSSDNNRYEILFNTDQTISTRVVARVASAETAGPTVVTGLTHVANTWYRVRAQSTSADATAVRLKVWLDGTTEPTTWTIHNTVSALLNGTAGKIGLTGTRETSNTNTNAVVEFDDLTFTDGWFPRHTGYVDQWPTRWNDAGLKQALAPITASGLTRRLNQGGVLASAIRRGVQTAGVVPKAYWPCEDASQATQVSSGIAAGLPMRISQPESLGGGQAVGSLPLITVTNTGRLVGAVKPYVGTDWQVMWLINVPAAVAAEQALLRWQTNGTYPTWQLVLTPAGGTDQVSLRAYDQNNIERLGDVGTDFTGEPYGTQLWIEVSAIQSGPDLNWSYTIWGASGKVGFKAAATAGTVTEVSFGNGSGANLLQGSALGHISVWDTAAITLGAYAQVGWAGETATARLARLGTQESTPTTLVTTPVADFATMGPPTATTLLAQFREIETAEQGVLYDEVDGSVALLPREARFNRAVTLPLDITQHQLGWPFEPTDDDQQLRNDVTSSQPSGSSYRYVDTTSANAVTGVGYYSTTRSVNLFNAADLRQDAEFAAALGTVDDLRYPQIPIDLNRNPSLIASWLAANIGSRLQITHPPSLLTPDLIDLILEGYTEFLSTKRWTAGLNTSSARPWRAWILENGSGNSSRLDSEASSIVTGFNTTATAMSVATLSGYPLWITGTGLSIDLNLAGEKVTATAISGSSSPQAFTITRSVNGVVKAQTANTKVSLWQPSVLAL